MICRRCLQRSAELVGRASTIPTATASRTFTLAPAAPRIRSLAAATTTPAATPRWYSSSPAPQPPTPGPEDPALSTPLGDAGAAGDKPVLSSCPEGTVLTGLNYFKNKTDPVALADAAYPEWLWRCMDVTRKAEDGADEDAGDEFSKSKKQRKLAARRARAAEARALAEGNLDALMPKIPLQEQSINLPGNDDGTVEGSIEAAAAREELRRAMRKERKAKIREDNYLKSM
ncbi:mitochondrial ribosomal protein L37-domain-containing protein [Microdochium bolleyi]|uniref:Large ribosomal subunit protein mL54 n=1 Tax=Microdochium bolleyi TaxID=196109 RepID=A0A136JEC1_9PEZI|nr:mitochondrial ribosomal protein L37-domain-containing protein [Microdochium bolleyi]